MKAKQLIEETFDIVLSKKIPYERQVAPLDREAALQNNKKLAEIIFFLAERVDAMQDEIEKLKPHNYANMETHTTFPDVIESPILKTSFES